MEGTGVASRLPEKRSPRSFQISIITASARAEADPSAVAFLFSLLLSCCWLFYFTLRNTENGCGGCVKHLFRMTLELCVGHHHDDGIPPRHPHRRRPSTFTFHHKYSLDGTTHTWSWERGVIQYMYALRLRPSLHPLPDRTAASHSPSTALLDVFKTPYLTVIPMI